MFFIPTALPWENPSIHQKKNKNLRGFPQKKTPQKNYLSTIHRFNFQTKHSNIFKNFPSNTALKHFKNRANVEAGYRLKLHEDQKVMETQPIYLSCDKSKSTTPCSSPDHQLPNNVPDSYDANTQLIASKHEQMCASGNTNLQ